jgi:hypothetical protein
MSARKLVRGLRQGLTEEERYRVADGVVDCLKQYGDPWRLSEELSKPMAADTVHATPPDLCKPK